MGAGQSLAQKASRKPSPGMADPLALGGSVQEAPARLWWVAVPSLEVQPGWGGFRWLLTGPVDISVLEAARRTTTLLRGVYGEEKSWIPLSKGQ